MKYLIGGLMFAVGVINFFPIVGVYSKETLTRLYGIEVAGPDLEILLRHRAVLFGLIGGLIFYSVWRPQWQWPVIVIGLASMVSFIALAFAVGGYGPGVDKIIAADVVGSLGLLVVIGLKLYAEPRV